MAVNKLTFFKFLELAITAACIGLHYKTMAESEEHTIMIVAGTFVGYAIILIALFAGYLMNTPINKRLDLFFSLIGCALFIAAGSLIIQHWENYSRSDRKTMALSKGALAIINGAVFFVDGIFTFRD